MPESSVDNYINAQPEEQNVLTFDDWMAENHPNSSKAINKFGGIDAPLPKFWNWFTGDSKKWEREYNTYVDNYLSNLKNRNEYLATQSANAFEKMMDDTKIQRSMNDYEKAGLNPYLLINGGSIGSGSVPTSAKADYSTNRSEKKANDSRNKALLLLALAKIAAALI